MTNYLAAELRQILDVFDGSRSVYQQLLRLTERVEAAGGQPVEVDASTELTANLGLEPEQAVRARAFEIAMHMPFDVKRWLLVNVAGKPDPGLFSPVIPGDVYDLAKIVAAFIRDGRPAVTTATAELCGHRWRRSSWCSSAQRVRHRCTEPAGHPTTEPHRCRCGATANRATEGD